MLLIIITLLSIVFCSSPNRAHLTHLDSDMKKLKVKNSEMLTGEWT